MSLYSIFAYLNISTCFCFSLCFYSSFIFNFYIANLLTNTCTSLCANAYFNTSLCMGISIFKTCLCTCFCMNFSTNTCFYSCITIVSACSCIRTSAYFCIYGSRCISYFSSRPACASASAWADVPWSAIIIHHLCWPLHQSSHQ